VKRRKPRRMARRTSRRIRTGRRVRWDRVVLVLLGLGGAGWGLPRIVAHIASQPIFELHQIRVSGHRLLPEQEVVRLSTLSVGMNSFEIDLKGVAQNLVRDPAVRSATVRRRLPDEIDLVLIERDPLVLVDLGDTCCVDEEGVVLGKYSEEMGGLPMLTGFTPPSDSLGGKVTGAGTREVLRFLWTTRRMDPAQVEEISEVGLDGSGGATLHLAAYAFDVRIQGDDAEGLWAKLRAALSCSEVAAGRPAYLDLRFDGQIVVGPYTDAPVESMEGSLGEG